MTNNRYDWSNVNWHRSNTQIAKILGCSPTAVPYQRKRLSPETIGKYTRGCPRYNWDKIDWTQTNREIANLIGTGRSYVNVKRRTYAPKSLKKAPRKLEGYVWDNIDWAKSNMQIAAKVGVSPSAVSYQRKRLAPDSNILYRPKKSYYKSYTKKHNSVINRRVWEVVDWRKSNAQIANNLNVSIYHVEKRRKEIASHTIDPIYHRRGIDYSNVDWSRGNLELATKFGVSPSAIYYQRKRRAPHTINKCSYLAAQQSYEWTTVDWGKDNTTIATDLIVRRQIKEGVTGEVITNEMIHNLAKRVSSYRTEMQLTSELVIS